MMCVGQNANCDIVISVSKFRTVKLKSYSALCHINNYEQLGSQNRAIIVSIKKFYGRHDTSFQPLRLTSSLY